MDVTKIPFNAFVGIKPSGDAGFLLELSPSESHLNHLKTVHASVQFALAEASSGEFLLRSFKEYADNIVPVVRKSEQKFRKPAEGRLRSKASMPPEEMEKVRTDLAAKGRALLTVQVEVFDSKDNLTLQAAFEWFVQKIS